MLRALARWFGLRMVRSNPQPARRLLGKYDAAQTTTENRRHWANADSLGAREANSPSVRRTLRMRSRYEVANNCYAAGIVRTLSDSIVGTGPRLQMQTPDRVFNEAVEKEFRRWAKKVRLASQLRLAREAQAVDGEAFIQLVTNPAAADPMRRTPQLDMRLVEAEQVSTPNLQPGQTDGIVFDAYGNPVTYHVLKGHPGEYGASNEKTDVPAAEMIHLFRRLRPGQVRGIPETTPGLPLFAMMRRYTLAVVTAAEVAACQAGVIETDQRSDEEGADATPYDQVEMERGMWTVMPDGWKATQFKPEQPTSTHAAFQASMINEIGRPWSMPKNIAMCDSSGYNYASGRLDHQTYFKFVDVDRADFELTALDRIVSAWLYEALLIQGFLPPFQGDADHDWYWDGSEHVDPSKEANAQQTRLASLTTTLAAEYAKEGKDWEAELKQIAKEREAMKGLGLEMPVVGPAGETQPAEAVEAKALPLPVPRVEPPQLQPVTVNVTNEVQAAEQQPPVVNVTNVNQQPAPVVNVQAAEQPAPVINVTNEVQAAEQPAPVINVSASPAVVHVKNDVAVNVPEQPAPTVNVTNEIKTPDKKIFIETDRDGNIKSAESVSKE